MKHIYYTKNWLIKDLEYFMKYVEIIQVLIAINFMIIGFKCYTKKESEIIQTIKNFIESKDHVVNIIIKISI